MNKLIGTQTVTRDYGLTGTRAIIDTDQGRILIEDGFGGMDTIRGGAVRWEHGSAYHLQSDDTFETLTADSEWLSAGDPMSVLTATLEQLDNSRPFLDWSGETIASVAQGVGLPS